MSNECLVTENGYELDLLRKSKFNFFLLKFIFILLFYGSWLLNTKLCLWGSQNHTSTLLPH